MPFGWPQGLTAYKLLTDWGSLISGLFALVAGVIAYVGALRAARRQTHALYAEIERPAIYVEPKRARWHTSRVPNIPFIEYSIGNHGRTAAIILSRRISAVVVETIPKIPPCASASEVLDCTSVVASGPLPDLTETIARGDDTDELDRVRKRTRTLIFSGIITYKGPFGRREYLTRFGWIFEPNDPDLPHSNERFLACNKPGYNDNT